MSTTRSGTTGAALTAVAALSTLLAGCGTAPDYEYLQSADGQVFAKIPSDWEVVSEGAVQFKFINQQEFARFGVVAGDSTQPWRADFNDGEPGVSPSGYVEAQHLDARIRNAIRISDIARGQRPAGATELRFDRVRVGDLTGYRSSYEYGEGDSLRHVEDVYLTNRRRSAVYIASVECGIDCYEQRRDDIVEVVESLWVES